jgi:hypothetical protein
VGATRLYGVEAMQPQIRLRQSSGVTGYTDVILKQKETKRAKTGYGANAHFFGRCLLRAHQPSNVATWMFLSP